MEYRDGEHDVVEALEHADKPWTQVEHEHSRKYKAKFAAFGRRIESDLPG